MSGIDLIRVGNANSCVVSTTSPKHVHGLELASSGEQFLSKGLYNHPAYLSKLYYEDDVACIYLFPTEHYSFLSLLSVSDTRYPVKEHESQETRIHFKTHVFLPLAFNSQGRITALYTIKRFCSRLPRDSGEKQIHKDVPEQRRALSTKFFRGFRLYGPRAT